MATKKPLPFEKSKKDVEPKRMKEGSKKEEAFDAKQMAGKVKKQAMPPAPAALGGGLAFRNGGKIGKC